MTTRTLAALAAVVGLGACSAQFNGVSIFAVCAPPVPDATDGSCTYAATCEATFAGTPVLDVTTAQLDFRMPVQIDNLLTDNSSAVDGRINTNDAVIQSFEMTYSGVDLPAWNVAATVTVPVSGSASAVLRLIPVQYFPTLLPPGASTANITVNVRAHGMFASQNSFTTAWFQVPVALCSNCLKAVTCPQGTSYAGACPTPAYNGTEPAPPGQTATPLCTAVTALTQ